MRKNETEILTDVIGMDTFEVAPTVASNALAAATKAQDMLAQALPSGELRQYPGQKPIVSDAERRRFMVEYEIATNPYWVMDRADDGSLNQEHMQILGKYYPSMHADIVAQLRQMADQPMNYQQRLVLSEILGEAVTPDTEPEVRAILGAAGPVSQQQQPTPTATQTRPHSSRKLQGHRLSSSTGSMTETQKTAFDTEE